MNKLGANSVTVVDMNRILGKFRVLQADRVRVVGPICGKLGLSSVTFMHKFKIWGSVGLFEGDYVRAVGRKPGLGWLGLDSTTFKFNLKAQRQQRRA